MAMFRRCALPHTGARLAVASCMLQRTAPTLISRASQLNSIIPACIAPIAGVRCQETKQLHSISVPFSAKRENSFYATWRPERGSRPGKECQLPGWRLSQYLSLRDASCICSNRHQSAAPFRISPGITECYIGRHVRKQISRSLSTKAHQR